MPRVVVAIWEVVISVILIDQLHLCIRIWDQVQVSETQLSIIRIPSQSTSRLGTTPFSPIQEAAPSLQGYPSSPEQVLSIKTASNDANSDDSVPPTPRDVKSAERPWSQPTLSS